MTQSQMNPHGILEAYWLYIEGVKPEGTPNSLIAAQPVVKDLREAVVRATQAFMAPPDAGTYNLRIHLTSTSVTGVNLAHDCTFTVVEDDDARTRVRRNECMVLVSSDSACPPFRLPAARLAAPETRVGSSQ